jgi:hypothetical protein
MGGQVSIHLTRSTGYHPWCGDRNTGAVRTVFTELATCLACLEKLADHHRIGAAKATMRIAEVAA